MRTSRFIRPIHISEFSALFLKVALMEEIGRIAITQEQARDRFDRDEWAMMTVKLRELRDHLGEIETGLMLLGPAPTEALEEYAEHIHREGYWLPRSKANRLKWDAHKKAEQKEHREHVEKVRAEIRAERGAKKQAATVGWSKPIVAPSAG